MRGGVGRAQSGSSLPPPTPKSCDGNLRKGRATVTPTGNTPKSRAASRGYSSCISRYIASPTSSRPFDSANSQALVVGGLRFLPRRGGPVVADRPALGLGREVRNVETPLVEEDVRLARLLEEGERTQPCVVKLARDIFPGNAGVSLGVTLKRALRASTGLLCRAWSGGAAASAKERPIVLTMTRRS